MSSHSCDLKNRESIIPTLVFQVKTRKHINNLVAALLFLKMSWLHVRISYIPAPWQYCSFHLVTWEPDLLFDIQSDEEANQVPHRPASFMETNEESLQQRARLTRIDGSV